MTFDTLTKDLGTIKIGIPVTFTFVLTAESYTVAFTRIQAGCGSCTVGNITKSAIAPDEEIDFTVTFTPNALGTQSKVISLTYVENSITVKKEFTFTAIVVA